MATTELVRTEGLVSNFEEATRAAKAMALSGYFADAKDISQAMVKVLAGHEMGFGPFASMTGIHVIKGKPSVGANLMAAAVKAHPRYDYRVRTMGDDTVSLEFFQQGESIGVSEFTEEDAKRAGTQNMGRFPRNMLFARAMSNGVRWFCPDVFAGSAVYTPGELGAEVDDDGDVIDAPVREIEPEPSDEYTGPYVNDGSPDAPEVEAVEGVVVEEVSQEAMTENEAAEFTTPQGTRYGELTLDQIVLVIEAYSKTKATKGLSDNQALSLKAAQIMRDYLRDGDIPF